MGTPENRSLFHQSRSTKSLPGGAGEGSWKPRAPTRNWFRQPAVQRPRNGFHKHWLRQGATASNQHKHWLHTAAPASFNQDIQPLGRSQMRLAAPGRKTSTGHKVGAWPVKHHQVSAAGSRSPASSLSGSSPAFFQPCTRSRKLLRLCLRSPPATHMLTRAPNARPAQRHIGIRNPEARTDSRSGQGPFGFVQQAAPAMFGLTKPTRC